MIAQLEYNYNMNAQEVAEKIFHDIQGRSTSTTTILRDTKALGKLLNISDFDWVMNELNGYDVNSAEIPPYRITSGIEQKSWTGTIPPLLLSGQTDFLYKDEWAKWIVFNPVSELEDLVATGITTDTGKVLKTLSSGYQTKVIYQKIFLQPREIKKILDLIQEKVHSQIIEYLSKPTLSTPSLAILAIYSKLFPELQTDLDSVSKFLTSGEDYLNAARATISILQKLSNRLVLISKPTGYTYSDGNKLTDFGEKSKMKYYLEFKGHELHHEKIRLLFLDGAFRNIYDVGSKVLKDGVNQFEANLCVNDLHTFLEQLYKYTNLKSISE